MTLDHSLTKDELKKNSYWTKISAEKQKIKKSSTKDRQVSISTECEYKNFLETCS